MESTSAQYTVTNGLVKTKDSEGRSVYNDKYTVLGSIESNSFAKIKLACQGDAKFAIKVFSKAALQSKKEYVRRADGKGMEAKTQLDKVLQHEIQAITKAQSHPNVVRLFEVIDDEEKLMLVMEFVEKGRAIEWVPEAHVFKPATWAQVESGYLAEDVIRKIVRDCVKALKHLHGRGIMHRDIKPQNVLVGKDDQTKLVDFGVSHVLKSP